MNPTFPAVYKYDWQAGVSRAVPDPGYVVHKPKGAFRRLMRKRVELQHGDDAKIKALPLTRGGLVQDPTQAFRALASGVATELYVVVTCKCGKTWPKRATEWRSGTNISMCRACGVKATRRVGPRPTSVTETVKSTKPKRKAA